MRIYYLSEAENLGGIHMTMQIISPDRQKIWRISRRFDGSKDPQAVLRALIQAHQA